MRVPGFIADIAESNFSCVEPSNGFRRDPEPPTLSTAEIQTSGSELRRFLGAPIAAGVTSKPIAARQRKDLLATLRIEDFQTAHAAG
jgi:hypothetical protein